MYERIVSKFGIVEEGEGGMWEFIRVGYDNLFWRRRLRLVLFSL